MAENRMREPKILRKNWHEVCYVYDDYDMHDVNYEIKAVGLGPFSFFNSCSNGFSKRHGFLNNWLSYVK